jgi:hypothetical protein
MNHSLSGGKQLPLPVHILREAKALSAANTAAMGEITTTARQALSASREVPQRSRSNGPHPLRRYHR